MERWKMTSRATENLEEKKRHFISLEKNKAGIKNIILINAF